MKRPLLAAALCVVVIAAIRLETGAVDRIRPGCISTKTLDASETLLVTGQIYQKDEQSVYLKSIILSDTYAIEQSAGNLRQEILSSGILSSEVLTSGTLSSEVQSPGILSPEILSSGILSSEVLSLGTLSPEILSSGILSSEVLPSGILSSEVLSSGTLSPENLLSEVLTSEILSPENKLSQVKHLSTGNLVDANYVSTSFASTNANITGENISNAESKYIMENLICETEAAAELPLGSWVTVSGIFIPFSSATNPGEFDGAVYYRTLGIGGKLRKTTILSKGESDWPVREGLYQLKCLCKKRLYAIFPEKEAAIMSALLLGDKKDLDNEVKDLYKRNGILHIFSISSLHITMIGMGIYRLLRKGGMPVLPSAVAGSVLLILYGCMTGFSVSACRAIGMYVIRMLGEVVGRTYDLLTALGVMAAVMVIKNPYYLQSGGFLLSFTSVLGIGVVFPALASEQHVHLLHSFYNTAFASLSITLTTLPVQLWFYYEIPTYSVFLNLFVIPLVKPMMITGILTLLPGLGWLSGVGHLILKSYEFLCVCFGKLPFHTWNPGCPEIWQIVVYYILLLGVVAVRYYEKEVERNKDGDRKWNEDKIGAKEWNDNKAGCRKWNRNKGEGRGRKIRENGSWGRGITCISMIVFWFAMLVLGFQPSNTDSVTFLDVGQGDCILIRTASGQAYLFDCGSSSRSRVGEYVLIPYLKYCGIHIIDAVFLSHPDADHVNGALELFASGRENGVTVRQLLLPAIEKEAREEQFGKLRQAVEEANIQGSTVLVGYLSAGDTWNCGSTTFTCLHPSAEYSSSDSNAYSECFYVEFPEWTLLLTGDVEGRGEETLLDELATRKIQGITVLKAAHHGSRNSSSEALLCQVSPRLTVISCGRNNRYGHPHKELLERLEQTTDTYIMQTAQSGAITITFNSGNLKVSSVISK